MLVAEGKRVVAIKADSVDELLGANTIAEMMHLDAAIRLATAKRLMAAGVTIFRPETCVIDSEVTVGPDTVIEPYVQLLGATKIGSESRVRSYSVIQNSTLGDNVLVRNGCILDTAEVADNAVLGPYAHLRPESRIGDGAHVGNFVETKKTTMGKGSKANHLTYLGDSVIGADVNIGAGAITCNYDGVAQAPHHNRRRCIRRFGLDPRRTANHRRRRLRRRRQQHHRRRPRGSAGPWTKPPGHQIRMGRPKQICQKQGPQ